MVRAPDDRAGSWRPARGRRRGDRPGEGDHGYAAVETSATIQLRVARKIDGTNWRGRAANEAALSGTNAAGRSQELIIGDVGVNEQVRIEALMSADATGDMELPFAVTFKGTTAPTVTAIAA